MRACLLLLACCALAPAARAYEADPRRANGFFGGVMGGGGPVDSSAAYPPDVVAASGISQLGLIDVGPRLGWRITLVPGFLGVSPLLEGRIGVAIGGNGGDLIGAWGVYGGGQLFFRPGAPVMPFVNFRYGVRGVRKQHGNAAAIGVGVDLPSGRYSTLLELTLEPMSPLLVSVRIGWVFF